MYQQQQQSTRTIKVQYCLHRTAQLPAADSHIILLSYCPSWSCFLQKYLTSRCQVRLLLEGFTVFAGSIELLLTWYIVVLGWYWHTAARKWHVQSICPNMSFIPTSAALVELFVFHCFYTMCMMHLFKIFSICLYGSSYLGVWCISFLNHLSGALSGYIMH